MIGYLKNHFENKVMSIRENCSQALLDIRCIVETEYSDFSFQMDGYNLLLIVKIDIRIGNVKLYILKEDSL